jgi:dolichyl-phosphate-mannose-protein mannosyltransferase
MSSTQTLRNRGDKPNKRKLTPEPSVAENIDAVLEKAHAEVAKPKKSEWDYKLALVILTIGAFITRFYGISHPNQVVFDEVHFGKVCSLGIKRESARC